MHWGVQQVINILAIANNDLPAIEERFQRLNDVSMLQFQKHTCKRNLYDLNNKIATKSTLLNSFHIYCERERRDIEDLYNKRTRLEATRHLHIQKAVCDQNMIPSDLQALESL